MSVVPNTAQRRVASPWKRLVALIVLVAIGGLMALVFEHWRGERALRIWKEAMVARGEVFDPRKLWPAPSGDAPAFSNQLAASLAQLPKGLNKYAGLVCGVDNDDSGQLCRSSRQPIPLGLHRATASTWFELNELLQQAEPGLRRIRELMSNPPNAMESDIMKRMDTDYVPNYSGTRQAAQCLAAATVNALHEQNLEGALDNLEALQGCVRLNADEPALVNFMVRVAVLGLGGSAGWDALQEDGWTEPQLLRLQKACQANDLFSQLPKVVAAERLGRVQSLHWFASHSYEEWRNRYREVLISFGMKPDDYEGAQWRRSWRQLVFHPVWTYAWRPQEELEYLKFSQEDLEIVRESVQRGAWVHLKTHQSELRDSYRRPPAHWRFYLTLPMLDRLNMNVGDKFVPEENCPYADFSRAWLATARNLNQHEMMITAIALKRYQLSHGRMPGELADMVPNYLKVLPRDFIDGRPLRYRSNANGSYLLYSIGENAQDDGGDSHPANPVSHPQQATFSSGRDWVWLPASGSSDYAQHAGH